MTNANYNYLEAVKADVRQWMEDNEYYINMADFSDADDFMEYLNDSMWTDDSVTGNGSGSYTFNSADAKEYVLADTETVREALSEFCCDAAEIGEKFLNEEWEWLDVTARCYCLGLAIGEVIEEIRDNIEEAIEAAHAEADEDF